VLILVSGMANAARIQPIASCTGLRPMYPEWTLRAVMPLSPGRAERHGFEYHRHGTLSLYAALNPQTGEVIGQTAPRHTSAEFVAFLAEVVASQPEDKEIHIILDNLSAHKTPLVSEFLQEHKNVTLHFTPTYDVDIPKDGPFRDCKVTPYCRSKANDPRALQTIAALREK
jgi:transposase